MVLVILINVVVVLTNVLAASYITVVTPIVPERGAVVRIVVPAHQRREHEHGRGEEHHRQVETLRVVETCYVHELTDSVSQCDGQCARVQGAAG